MLCGDGLQLAVVGLENVDEFESVLDVFLD